MSKAADHWQELFENWPSKLSRRGTLVVSFGDQIPFCGFSTKDGLLLIQRSTPDSVGARQLVIPYSEIVALKITEVVAGNAFAEAGFAGELVLA
jgi:hypothetical protein